MRFSLGSLFLAITGTAIMLLWFSPASYNYVHTGRPDDITVIGNGWLHATDLNTNKRKFFKSCRLTFSEYSELVATVDGCKVVFEPRIPVEGPIDNVRCSSDGQIGVLSEESSALIHFGQVNLAVLHSSAKGYVLEDEQLESPPMIYAANSATGYIQSGWLLKQESLVDRFKSLSFGEIAILIVACGILIKLFRPTPQQPQSSA